MTRTIPKAIQNALPRQKPAAQIDYEKDLEKNPTYHDGSPRRTWAQLDDVSRWSWSRMLKQEA